jgi:hypothetical protein
MAKKKTSSVQTEKKEGLPDVKLAPAHEIKTVEKLEIIVKGSKRVLPKVEHEIVSSTGELRFIYNSSYDSNGNKVEMSKTDAQGKYLCWWEYEWKSVEKDKQVTWYQSKVIAYGPEGIANPLWEAKFAENGTLVSAQTFNPKYAFDIETKTIISDEEYSKRLNQRIKQAYISLQQKDPTNKLLGLFDATHEPIFFTSGITETYALLGREHNVPGLNDTTKLCEAYIQDLRGALEKKADAQACSPTEAH